MKKITLFATLITIFTLFTLNMSAQVKPTAEALKNLEPYPIAIDSLERHVIFLKQKEFEVLYKVELIAGKSMEVDCNHHNLLGQFEEAVVEGWGYNYYIFETSGQVASTMMMCHDTKTTKFVSGPTEMVRYNSRLPIVVYLPKGYDLKYQIWSAGEEQTASKQ